MPSHHCPKCQRTMAAGYVPDMGYGKVWLLSWLEGVPQFGRWLGNSVKLWGKKQMPMTAYRCPGCGYVEFYAPEPPPA